MTSKLPITTSEVNPVTSKKMAPLHPGEILLEELLRPMNLSQNRLALDIRVPARRINEIVLGKRRITADTALRLESISTCPRNSGWGYKWIMTLM